MKHFCSYLGLFAVLLLNSGCATQPVEANVDPFEPANRAVFAFNERLDSGVVRPLAKGYVAVTPSPVRRGIRNFFANLEDLGGTLNAVLQFRFAEAGRNSGRFLVNIARASARRSREAQ